jgi:hypothetical protein
VRIVNSIKRVSAERMAEKAENTYEDASLHNDFTFSRERSPNGSPHNEKSVATDNIQHIHMTTPFTSMVRKGEDTLSLGSMRSNTGSKIDSKVIEKLFVQLRLLVR